jgi:hypothetical protein
LSHPRHPQPLRRRNPTKAALPFQRHRSNINNVAELVAHAKWEATGVAGVTESHLCDLAMAATASQIDKIVRAMRKISRNEAREQIESRSCSWSVDDDGSLVITLKLPTEIGYAVIGAVNGRAKFEKGVPFALTAADAMVELILEDGVVRGEVVVHVHPDQVHVEDGPAVAPEIAEALACNGTVTTVMETPDGPVVLDRQRAANKRQRRWLAFRHQTC